MAFYCHQFPRKNQALDYCCGIRALSKTHSLMKNSSRFHHVGFIMGRYSQQNNEGSRYAIPYRTMYLGPDSRSSAHDVATCQSVSSILGTERPSAGSLYRVQVHWGGGVKRCRRHGRQGKDRHLHKERYTQPETNNSVHILRSRNHFILHD